MVISTQETAKVGNFLPVVLLVVSLAFFVPAQAAVWHVNAASTAPVPDGQSWATAYPALQPAVDAAASGDEVWVAAGTYTGTGAQVVSLKAGVTLYGGFAGTETLREQRNWTENGTILDGQGARRCVTAADATCTVDGLTIQKGRAGDGGGMYNGAATDCYFDGNAANRGGGMFGGSAARCTFANNRAFTCPRGNLPYGLVASKAAGGGMAYGHAVNCLFWANLSQDAGGGMSDGTATHCTLSGNGAVDGGGMSGGVAVNCIIWGNASNETHETDVSFSCLSEVTAGSGNVVAAEPGFVNPWAGDYRLRAGSPGIDAGTADGGIAVDILGRIRPQGSAVDMGAYEFYPGDDDAVVSAPAVLRVNAASTAAVPDGLCWATAFPTIQAAVAHAGQGSEIWVARGTYTATDGYNVLLVAWPGVSVFGGFTGVETAREQRDRLANPTVINGAYSRRCAMVNDASVLDGFTLRHGEATEGAGMCGGVAVDCAFLDNGSSGGYGGGMFKGRAERCTFAGNENRCGGGMSGGTAIGCTFYDNEADDNGGGMYEGAAINCVFYENRAKYGGGMYEGAAINCTIVRNRVPQGGGGIDGGSAVNCIIWGITLTEVSRAAVSHSCLSTVTDGVGNIVVGEPGFVNPWAGDFRLRANSPCVDSGTPEGAPDTDLLGRARPQGGGLDMGAHEYTPGDDEHAQLTPAVLRVNAASISVAPDGLTWETAYSTLQEAADRAGYGTEIWVVQGTYVAAASEVLLLPWPGISVYGGFAGTETARDQRNWTENVTIIDGQAARRCVTGNDSGTVDGLTLQNGRADYGGGMYKGSASNCAFVGNSASTSGGGMYGGTALNCVFFWNVAGDYGGGATLTATVNCTLTRNTAKIFGGGLRGGSAKNCIVWENYPDDSASMSTDAISYSCFSRETAGEGNIVADPAFVNPWAGNFRLPAHSPCVDAGTAVGAPMSDLLGRSRPQGLGVDMGACEHSAGDDDLVALSPPVLRVDAASTADVPDGLTWATAFSTLQDVANHLGSGTEIWVARGVYTAPRGTQVLFLWPGISVYGGFSGTETVRDERNWTENPTIIDGQKARRCITANEGCRVDGFTLMNGYEYGYTNGGYAFGYGGGMHSGTACNCIFTANQASMYGGGMYKGVAENCVFSRNEANRGGGLYSGNAVNCAFLENHANERWYCVMEDCWPAYGDGGGMFDGDAVNCIFWGNWPNDTSLDSTVSYSCLSAAFAGIGNMAADPLFVDAAAGDFQLQPASPCIDAGTGEGAPSLDFLGVPRPQGAGWDMGAYESVVNVTVPDLTGLARTAARELTAAARLYVRNESEEYHATIPTDHVIRHTPAAGVQVAERTLVDLVLSKGPEPVTVPDVAGQAQGTASSLVTEAGLAVGTVTEEYSAMVPTGAVISQHPAAGTAVLPGTPVDLVLSKGPQPVTVPDVAGQAQGAALLLVTEAGLAVGTVTQQYSAAVPVGVVISQLPEAGTPVLPGTPVDLVLSRGPQPVTVPDVAGQAQGAASLLVAEAGLVVGTVTQEYSATVPVGAIISQMPTAGTPVLPGMPVDLAVSRGVQPSVMPEVAGQARAQAEAAVTGAGLTLGLVTEAHSGTVAAGAVISQSPAAGTELPPGTAVSLVVSLGPAPVAEGEGEPVDADTARQALAQAFDASDSNDDGTLSFGEAGAAVPGLTQSVFDELDTDGDGQLSPEELGLENGSGCAAGCRGGKNAFTPAGYGRRLGDLFLLALGVLGLAAMSTLRRP